MTTRELAATKHIVELNAMAESGILTIGSQGDLLVYGWSHVASLDTINLAEYIAERMCLTSYYVSLVMGLQGLYVHFLASSEDEVREYCAKHMGSMWCSVYQNLNELIGPVKIINTAPIVVSDYE